MTNRTTNKIKQRKKRLEKPQTPVVMRKVTKWWFLTLTIILIFIIVYLLYSTHTNDFTNRLIISIIIAITVLLLLIIWYLPKLYISTLPIEAGKNFDREKERLKLEDDTRKTFAQIIGGVVILGGLIFTYNTYRIQVEQVKIQTKQQEIAQEGQITDRFTKAVTQIGDEKLEVRLGGLYALERIAIDSPKDHWTVMEILSAYVRENAKKKEDIENNKNETSNKVRTDIQAALTIIGRRKFEQDSETDRINLSETNLAGANLIEANLSRVSLYNTNLSNAYLVETNLKEANLNNANLASALMNGADLRGAYLMNVENLDLEFIGFAIIDEQTNLPNYLEDSKATLLEASKENLEKKKNKQK